MYYLGIDIGKNNHVASLLDDGGSPVFKAFSFTNTTDGGESLIKKLLSVCNDVSIFDVGMEATGHYWLSLYSFLLEKGFKIHVINAIQTDGWRKGVEIRKRKTDNIDSLLIADLVRYGDFVETALSDEDMMSLRTLTRFRSYLVDSIADLKRKIICVLDQVFPEYQSVFSNIFGVTSKEILSTFSSPSELEELSVENLAVLLSTLSRKKIDFEKADKLSKLAKNSFGVKFCKDSFSFQLRMLIEQMKFIEQQVKDTEGEIKSLLSKINSPITSIPGIGPVLGAVILGEIGDINKFDNPAKLVAYAGIDATVSQSGEYERTTNWMSKRGSPYLRRALYQASLVAYNNDPILNAFYQKKKSEGKHHLTVIGAVSRKLCYIIYTILKENRPYEIRNL